MPEEFLRRVYDLPTQEATDAYYSAWSATYDDELTRNGYRTPQRCAEALARFVPLDAPVLDFGCGTGLSGAALMAAGFTDVCGHDVNERMVERARRAGVYRDVRVSDPTDPFPFEPGMYAAITAIGVIGIGAAPAALLGEALDALPSGGHIVFSYNEQLLELSEFMQPLAEALDTGRAEQLSSECGPHLEQLGSNSTVYALRRT